MKTYKMTIAGLERELPICTVNEKLDIAAFIMFIGYLVFPAKKGVQKVNHMPWYDIILMLAGTGAFLYFTINATEIVSRFKIASLEVAIGVIGILCLAELCRRSVGLPILIVAGVPITPIFLFLVAANADFTAG